VFTAEYGINQLIFSLQRFNSLPVLSFPLTQFNQQISLRYDFLNYMFYGQYAES
jgi:hypothetical protein